MKQLLFILISMMAIQGNAQNNIKESYVIEITTFQFKEDVSPEAFWAADKAVESNYTSLQPGYISRESGYAKDQNEVLVLVKWKTSEDAEASMKKFMTDNSVKDYAMMIEGSSMKMMRYVVE
ncbi:MAG: hypothetical protein AAFU57_16565 [Bacteroidota bacterium]